MKFYNWLNEDIDVGTELIFKEIAKKCDKYLQALTSNPIDRFLISGRKNKPNHFVGTVRENREPRDTPPELHKYADNLFYEEFRIRARSNTLFCATTPHAVQTYGTPYIIFPIGSYKLIWSSEIEDFYGDVMDDLLNKSDTKLKEEIADAVKTYKLTKEIPVKISSFTEIMVYCKKYYALDYNLFLPMVVEWLERDYNAKLGSSSVIHKDI